MFLKQQLRDDYSIREGYTLYIQTGTKTHTYSRSYQRENRLHLVKVTHSVYDVDFLFGFPITIVSWLVGWLVGWLGGWVGGWVGGWLVGWLVS